MPFSVGPLTASCSLLSALAAVFLDRLGRPRCPDVQARCFCSAPGSLDLERESRPEPPTFEAPVSLSLCLALGLLSFAVGVLSTLVFCRAGSDRSRSASERDRAVAQRRLGYFK